MEYFPSDRLDNEGDRREEIAYLTSFLRGLLQRNSDVQCAECGTPTRVLVITSDSSFVCVPCATAMDIVENQTVGEYLRTDSQIGD